ncbi:hypothetical protein AOG2_01960 [Geobacter sp. AOG2]|nr:hypothetical protein AOG2_01960 [Geobacter sp. AOG2]
MIKEGFVYRKTGLFMVGCLLAGLCGCSNKADLSGKWGGRMTLPETGKSLSDLEFELTQKAGEIHGIMNFTKVAGAKVKLSGTRNGDELKFTTEHKRGLSVSFTGTVKSGSRINGKAILAYSDPKVPVKQDSVTLEMTKK